LINKFVRVNKEEKEGITKSKDCLTQGAYTRSFTIKLANGLLFLRLEDGYAIIIYRNWGCSITHINHGF
jgi:hypothetical protein